MIVAGRVQVNGATVTRLGTRVDPRQDTVHVDGMRVTLRDDLAYFALNKPRGVVSSMSDDRGRPTVGDYVAGIDDRLFHVGRLDQDSEGLLLLTNDGELGNRLTHPRYEVPKTYLVEIAAPVPRDLGRRLRSGVELDDGPARVDRFQLVEASNGRALIEIVLHEGRTHIVRRMLAEVGHPVSRLVRTEIGPIRLGHQRPGTLRRLTSPEIGRLSQLVDL